MLYHPAEELLKKFAAEQGEKAALLCEGRSISYTELYTTVRNYAGLLMSDTLQAGDRVLIALQDSPEFVCAFLGCIQAGLVPVPCSDLLDQERLELLLHDCRATALFGCSNASASSAVSPYLKCRYLVDSPQWIEHLSTVQPCSHPQPVSDDAVCFILYTSGSTGAPKPVPHRARMLLPETDRLAGLLNITADDLLFSVSKMHFGFGLLNSILHGLGTGATVLLLPGKPTISSLRQIITESRPTLLFAVPAVYRLLLGEAETLFQKSRLRLCVSSGEALEQDLLIDWQKRTGVEIIDSVGVSETFHPFIAGRPGYAVPPGAAGMVIPPWQARIVDATGAGLPDGISGFLEVRDGSGNPCTGTDGQNDTGSWLRTGDIFVASDNLFTFVGRADDMFKCDGNWASPLPIESALRAHPAVEECAVRARRILSAYRPEAHIVLKPGWSASTELERDLFTFIRSRLPAQLCPVQFLFHTELPKTGTGKIRRNMLEP